MFRKLHNTSYSIIDLDLLSSIWILSCNDKDPKITFRGIVQRLDLTDDKHVRELVQMHGELFRKQISETELKKWKTEMLDGKNLPTWLREIIDSKKRKETIENLTRKDVFRSQFRAQPNSDRSEIEIIDWGLKHIDRIRTSKKDSEQAKIQKFASYWAPLLTSIVAIISIFSSSYFQYKASESQEFLKHYEIELKPKQEGYTNLIKSMSAAFLAAQEHNSEKMYFNLDNAESFYLQIEPFLSGENRSLINSNLINYQAFCGKILDSDTKKNPSRFVNEFLQRRNQIRDSLFMNLFKKG